MSQINTDLEALKTARDNMKTALEGKGQTVTKDIRTYANAIANIPTEGGGVKLFETEQAMQADATAEEGDLATIYTQVTGDYDGVSNISSITFPSTVTFDTAISSSYRCYGSGTGSRPLSIDGSLSASNMMFRISFEGKKTIKYTSSDGLTYTRTDSLSETINFDEDYEMNWNEFNDNFKPFMQVMGYYFGGLYKYKTNNIHSDINIPISSFGYENNDIVWTDTNLEITSNHKELIESAIVAAYNYVGKPVSVDSTLFGVIFCNNDLSHIYIYTMNEFNMTFSTILFDSNGTLYFKATGSNTVTGYDYDVTLETITPISLTSSVSGSTTFYSGIIGNLVNAYYGGFKNMSIKYRANITDSDVTTKDKFVNYKKVDEYIPAPSQLTATAGDVYLTNFIGKNGAETGILASTISNSFADTSAEIYLKVKNAYESMSPRVLTDNDRKIDKNIQFIPTKSNGTPLLDTSAVTSMQNMFDGCKNLTTIPLLDTHNVTTFYYTFISCSNLINIPLINTSSAVNTSFMFSGCSSMTSVPELDLSNVTNTSYMFYGCKALESAPAFNTSKATNMSYMYEDCTNLKRVGQIDISKATNISYMFCSCTSLEEIDLSGGTITNTNPERTFLFQYVPTNCTIYVKDQTSKTTLEGWDSTHTYTIKP